MLFILKLISILIVIKSYKATKGEELSVNEGDEVHVIDATAHIQVRY